MIDGQVASKDRCTDVTGFFFSELCVIGNDRPLSAPCWHAGRCVGGRERAYGDGAFFYLLTEVIMFKEDGF